MFKIYIILMKTVLFLFCMFLDILSLMNIFRYYSMIVFIVIKPVIIKLYL